MAINNLHLSSIAIHIYNTDNPNPIKQIVNIDNRNLALGGIFKFSNHFPK